MSELNNQVGGSHYLGMAVQPVQLAYAAFKGDACVYNILKYLTRKKEGWEIQTGKAAHLFRMLVEFQRHIDIQFEETFASRQLIRVFIEDQPEPLHRTFDALITKLYAIPQWNSIDDECNAVLGYYTQSEGEVGE
ncbi:hypothetical protein NVP1261O_19 [Vibrio phage 1.261.O._10N.286.51.A7]|uniref:Uncharacterized protein n=1 Tax=Vibrio phage 1.261.O._10N.286.51.A7 TaxID=1881237 RepID=A0A2I7RZE7_9CAUD|nr:hypothetical protein HOU80_gp19 [Vibrio phage 1.261.O._10N.286.51.A7]AUR99023.1 hypothetical protein NVP1261O_19 [Vibrio phage 1.261.O._10N.286.51.A7]